MEFEEEIDTTAVEKGKARTPRKFDHTDISLKTRKVNGIMLCLTKPSYALKRGIRRQIRSLRCEHRGILRHLLRQLVRQHNWDEAAGVLSVLLKGTSRENSIAKSRTKYWATMELLQRVKDVRMKPRKTQNVYEIWMRKIGSERGRSVKDRVMVQLEFILFCLAHGDTEGAYQVVISLMQEREFGSNPISNLVAGLVFCRLWYSAIQKELQLKDLDEQYTPVESETKGSIVNMSVDYSNGHGSVQVQESSSPFQCDSNTSIRIGKEFGQEEVVDQQREVIMEMDVNLQREPSRHDYHSQGFNSKSAASDGSDKSYLSTHSGQMPFGSIFYAHDLEPWLLPLRLPRTDQVEDFIYVQGRIHNDYYKGAVKHLQIALHSTPPAFEALLPLIQILLLGDQVKEAVDEVEKFVQISDAALPLRIKASLMEQFCSNDYAKLWTCFEETLKRDPKCNHSLMKLISMHHDGYYSGEKLLEMIALHLDATYGECNTWKEFASCFLKISQCEEDRMSMCMDATDGCRQSYSNHFNTIPAMFKVGVSRKNWTLRCKWWLTRHFRQSLLASEVDAGDLELLTYKAAAASHLYGPKIKASLMEQFCSNDYAKLWTCFEETRKRDPTCNHSLMKLISMHHHDGDRYLKPWIIPDPEVMFVPRAREDDCLILASDGLWDVMTNEEVCEMARKRILMWHKKNGATLAMERGEGIDPAAQAAAEFISNRALQKGSKDNITVIVVDLKAQRKFKTKA